jgi:hypothetical protein
VALGIRQGSFNSKKPITLEWEQMEEEPMTEPGYTLVKGKKKRANQKYSYPVGMKGAPR